MKALAALLKVGEILTEAKERRLKYVFAITSEERVGVFFKRLGFKRAGRREVPAAKWRGYDSARIKHISIFRIDLD